MRFARAAAHAGGWAAAFGLAGLAASGCGSQAWEAATVAGVAGAVELAEVAAADRAAHDAWMPHRGCDHVGQPECYVPIGMTLDEARAHAAHVINLVRLQSGLPPLAADFALAASAQEGSKQLSYDHRPHAHIAGDPDSCLGCSEVQGDPSGFPTGPIAEQIDSVIDGWIREGPGGANHDVLVSRRWHRLGVGVANSEGPLYLTVDLAP